MVSCFVHGGPMSRLTERFVSLRQQQEKALIAYIAAGDPDLETTPLLVRAMAESGVDAVELGLPFSDPLADGPAIQAGTQRALAAGANTDRVLEMIGRMRTDGITIPLLIMTYYNLLLRPGLGTFCARAKAAGVDGLIIPDVPVEESGELVSATREHGLDLVQFVTPASPPDRIRQAAELATGFVYCVSLTGVTGARTELSDRFQAVVKAARRHTDTPVAVGFGISTPEQVRQVAQEADGVIVGSAIVKLCGQGLPRAELAARVGSFVRDLKAATRA